jgi:hypothetical protein
LSLEINSLQRTIPRFRAHTMLHNSCCLVGITTGFQVVYSQPVCWSSAQNTSTRCANDFYLCAAFVVFHGSLSKFTVYRECWDIIDWIETFILSSKCILLVDDEIVRSGTPCPCFCDYDRCNAPQNSVILHRGDPHIGEKIRNLSRDYNGNLSHALHQNYWARLSYIRSLRNLAKVSHASTSHPHLMPTTIVDKEPRIPIVEPYRGFAIYAALLMFLAISCSIAIAVRIHVRKIHYRRHQKMVPWSVTFRGTEETAVDAQNGEAY